MKRLFYAAGLFTLLASVHAFGQTEVAQANIPFNFQLGGKVMPAGKYLFSQSRFVLHVKNASGQPAVMLMTSPVSNRAVHADPTLEFQRYGDQYFLSKVWSPASKEGVALFKSKREKELARRSTFERTSEVALQAQTPDREAK